VLLIVTERGDLTADWLILELERRQAPFVRFNTEDYPTVAMLAWTLEGAKLTLGAAAYELTDFDAVWYRRPVAPALPTDLPDEQREWSTREAIEALLGVWRTLDATWVNHPDRNRLAESKPEQLRTAQQLGFDVPVTLVTNQRERLREFLAEHPDGVVLKPLWNGRVPTSEGEEQLFFTTPIDPDSVDVEALGPEPYLFQTRVPKQVDVRVTVIGDEALAAAVDSQGHPETATDWRRSPAGALPHAVEELPDEVAARCIALCRHYGLQFGAIDLARRPDGGYTFFELNPNGQWAWVEQRTGLPLRARLADLLLHQAPS
jgi:glutathione synthase/RimK-type ligase-like ATP-grasp enzyme